MAMDKLSSEIYLTFLDYLTDKDKFSWSSCCSHWYTEVYKNHLRKLQIYLWKWKTDEQVKTLIETIPKVIKQPFQQLIIMLDQYTPVLSLRLFQLLEAVNFSVYQLECSIQNIFALTSMKSDIVISAHFFSVRNESMYEGDDNRVLEHFELSRLQRLTCTQINSLLYNPLLLSRLIQLRLLECEIVDVSMFGDIPDLYIEYCHNITDISALNYNRSVAIIGCEGIFDFSRSFANSESIHLEIACPDHDPILNTKHWKKVKSLKIICQYKYDLSQPLELPFTLLKCKIEGIPFNYSLTDGHALREVKIHFNDKIQSVRNLGWERLKVIELNSLSNLQSLAGIGAGKNQRVMIRYCPSIRGFSALRHVHEVEIWTDCPVNLNELDHVHTLHIRTTDQLIVDHTNPYEHIHNLHIAEVSRLAGIQGLGRIPYLTIRDSYFEKLMPFLVEGGKLYNQKLVIETGFSHQAEGLKRKLQRVANLLVEKYQVDEYDLFLNDHWSITFLRKACNIN